MLKKILSNTIVRLILAVLIGLLALSMCFKDVFFEDFWLGLP